jgi:predicted secreted hydrolase
MAARVSVSRLVALAAGVLAGVLAGGHCLRAVAAPPTPPGTVPGRSEAAGFQQALPGRAFDFPRDHGPHPGFRHEWWYLTGNLDAANGERFGFELTFFRFALLPPATPPPGAGAAVATPAPGAPTPSAWRARDIYMAHFAVSDVAQRRFRFAQKLSRAALGLAGAEAQPLRVWIDDWSLAEPGPSDSTWALHAAQPGYEIALTLVPQGAPVLNGADGLSRKSDRPADASYYYSIPRVAVRGRLLRGTQALEVQGLAWLDREWGSGGLGASEEGWDWFALQLDDGTALMFYALRDQGGGRDRHSAGTWVAADTGTRALANADVDIAATAGWRNSDGVSYPAGWRVRIPTLALDVSVRPVLADQELKTSPPYWEGAVDVSGTRAGRRVGGRGYVELVGYAQER